MTTFYVLSLVAILSSVLLITNQNPVYSVLSLVLVFVTGSIILLMLSVDFLPFVVIWLYVGSISLIYVIANNLHIQSLIRSHLASVKIKCNKDITQYYICFTSLVLFAIIWPFYWWNLSILSVLGLFFNLLGFYWVISITYPKTLPVFTGLEKKLKFSFSKIIKFAGYLVVVGVSFYMVRRYFFSVLTSFLNFVVSYPYFYIGLLVVVCLLLGMGGVYYVKNQFSEFTAHKLLELLKIKSPSTSWSFRKIGLFFRKYPAGQNLIPLYLAAITAIQNSWVVIIFVGISMRYHGGLEAYIWFVFVIITSFVVTLPLFRNYFLTKYGNKSFRMVGWNGLPDNVIKAGIYAAFGKLAMWCSDLANEEVKRINVLRDFENRQRIADLANERSAALHRQDPRTTTKYVTAVDLDSKGQLNSHGKSRIKGNIPPAVITVEKRPPLHLTVDELLKNINSQNSEQDRLLSEKEKPKIKN